MKKIITMLMVVLCLTMAASAAFASKSADQLTAQDEANDLRQLDLENRLPWADCLGSIAQTHADYEVTQNQQIQINNLYDKIHDSCGTPAGTFIAGSGSVLESGSPTIRQCVAFDASQTGAPYQNPAETIGTGVSNAGRPKVACVLITKHNL